VFARIQLFWEEILEKPIGKVVEQLLKLKELIPTTVALPLTTAVKGPLKGKQNLYKIKTEYAFIKMNVLKSTIELSNLT
jgi:hypothetical protein